ISNLMLRESIHKQVIEDALTGLYNRRYFHDKLEQEFRRAVRYGRELALLVLDIDHFKSINDSHGHAQGDVVLALLGNKLQQSFRELDTVARIGGEEFAIIMPETTLENAKLKAERLRQAIMTTTIELSASKMLSETNTHMHITVSIGAATIASGIDGPEHLFQEADRALYIAKNSGRNRVCVA
ncbi:MAG: GGDEF domain-containing protein, partial [Planctomycetes bacterium]|nr:GGDEF domain-containing protein [Planctomycetota bacterium]